MSLYPPCFREEPAPYDNDCLPLSAPIESLPITVVTYCDADRLIPWLLDTKSGATSRSLKHLVWYSTWSADHGRRPLCGERTHHLSNIYVLYIDRFACEDIMQRGIAFPKCRCIWIDRRGLCRVPLHPRHDDTDDNWMSITRHLDSIVPNVEKMYIVEDYDEDSLLPFRAWTSTAPAHVPSLRRLESIVFLIHACEETPNFRTTVDDISERTRRASSSWGSALPRLRSIVVQYAVDHGHSSCFELGDNGDDEDDILKPCFVAPSFSLLCWPRGPAVLPQ